MNENKNVSQTWRNTVHAGRAKKHVKNTWIHTGIIAKLYEYQESRKINHHTKKDGHTSYRNANEKRKKRTGTTRPVKALVQLTEKKMGKEMRREVYLFYAQKELSQGRQNKKKKWGKTTCAQHDRRNKNMHSREHVQVGGGGNTCKQHNQHVCDRRQEKKGGESTQRNTHNKIRRKVTDRRKWITTT